MKMIFMLIVSVLAFQVARAQTERVQICNSGTCDVFVVLFAGNCDNPQYKVLSEAIPVPRGTNTVRYLNGTPFIWYGPIFPGYAITGMRVYSDDPASGCTGLTYQDVMAPVAGPLPLIVNTTISPVCGMACPPVRVFFETYCSTPTNIFCIW